MKKTNDSNDNHHPEKVERSSSNSVFYRRGIMSLAIHITDDIINRIAIQISEEDSQYRTLILKSRKDLVDLSLILNEYLMNSHKL